MASTRAKPSIVIVKTSPRAAGLRPTAPMKDEKTLPMPIPAPITPIMAKPAPMSFAASISIGHFPFTVMFQFFDWLRTPVRADALVQVEGVVDVETGQNREDVGLQAGDQDLQPRQQIGRASGRERVCQYV